MPEWLTVLMTTLGLFILLLLVAPRLARKPMSGMTLFDYIAGLVLAVMIALTALGTIKRPLGLVGLGVWLAAVIASQYLVIKSKWLHDLIYGKELVLIKNGKIMEENLYSTKMTGEELLSHLRRKNIFNVADVEFAVMESNGDISALLKREKQMLTPQDMRLSISQIKEPQTVILDGNILDESLTNIGLNRDWLYTELNKIGVNPENVFVGQVDSMGDLYVDLFDDALELPQPKAKMLLLSSLSKAEADLMSFALETENEEWRKKYSQHASQIRAIINRLEPHLNT